MQRRHGFFDKEDHTNHGYLTGHKHRNEECSHIKHSILRFTETEEDFKVTAERLISYLHEVPVQSCSQGSTHNLKQKQDARSSHICTWYSKHTNKKLQRFLLLKFFKRMCRDQDVSKISKQQECLWHTGTVWSYRMTTQSIWAAHTGTSKLWGCAERITNPHEAIKTNNSPPQKTKQKHLYISEVPQAKHKFTGMHTASVGRLNLLNQIGST